MRWQCLPIRSMAESNLVSWNPVRHASPVIRAVYRFTLAWLNSACDRQMTSICIGFTCCSYSDSFFCKQKGTSHHAELRLAALYFFKCHLAAVAIVFRSFKVNNCCRSFWETSHISTTMRLAVCLSLVASHSTSYQIYQMARSLWQSWRRPSGYTDTLFQQLCSDPSGRMDLRRPLQR